MSLLEVEKLGVAFGGVAAVDDVSFAVNDGSLVGLIGPNGAGKTTCIEALTGYLPQATGVVRFLDRDLTGLPPIVGLGSAWHERSSRSSCSTTSPFATTSAPLPTGAISGSRSETSSPRAGTTTNRPSIEPSTSSDSPTPLTPSPPSCHKASASWPASPGPSRPGPACCSSTNQPRDSTAPRRSRSDADCATSSTTA